MLFSKTIPSNKNEPQKKSSVFKRFITYLYPVKWNLFGAIICGFYKFILPVIIAWIIGEIVDITTKSEININEKYYKIINLTMLSFVLIIISPLFVYWRNTFSCIAMEKSLNNLRIDLFSHIQLQSHSFFNSNQSGSLASRIISDVSKCEQFISEVMVTSWLQIAVISTIFSYFIYTNWLMAILSVFLVPIHAYLLKLIGKKIKLLAKDAQKENSLLSGASVESFINFNIIKSFTAENYVNQRFSDLSFNLMDKSTKMGKLTAWSQVINALIVHSAPMIVVTLGCLLIIYGESDISLSELVTFILMQRQMFDPLSKLAAMQSTISQSQGALERIYDILDTTPEIHNFNYTKKINSIKYDIEFIHVDFNYSNGYGLKNINLKIEHGSSCAIIGASGSGKSTIVSLLPRFYDVQNGLITINNINITEFNLRELRQSIAFVPQEPLLFSNSVYDNILIGNPLASEKQIYNAAKKSFIHDKIIQLPKGYATSIGERGMLLSGGERQRIAIARAFVKDPKILILDEATNALDSESEEIVHKALLQLMSNRTSIVIAHKLKHVISTDKIVVLDKGEIIEIGTHDNLIKSSDKYFNMWSKQ